MKFYKNAGRVDKNVTFVDNNRFMLIETMISIIAFAMNREHASLQSCIFAGITPTTRLQLINYYRNIGLVEKNTTFVDNNRFMLIETVIV